MICFNTPIARYLAPLLGALLLHGCGGSDSGADVTSNPPPAGGGGGLYTGPVARNLDVVAFQSNLWNNISDSDRCGGCHVQNQQSPSFARNDDINLAYNLANTVVNLNTPANSEMVTKVAGGHQCWLDSDAACADQLTIWITNWANAGNAGSATDIVFTAPPVRQPGNSRYYPTDPSLFQSNVYPIFRNFCVECHEPGAEVPITPYFAHDDVQTAYLAAQGVMNLNTPASSRVVQRLELDNHNCWTTDCDADATTLTNAIATMASGITPSAPPADLVLSNALVLDDGILASSGGRYDSHQIARYEFRHSGDDLTAYDTSGIEPAANLTLIGDVEWVGGWGIRINDGKAQASTGTSVKLYDYIQSSSQFSVEAWVVPSTPAQDMANIVSYSASSTLRNFTLAQSDDRYSFALRHNGTDLNGMPELDSPDASLQASLQHVVLTYDSSNGRRLYINGVDTGSIDPVAPDSLSAWNDTYALVLGNEASSDRLWQGVIRFVAIHDSALTPEQVEQNFSAGVGERRYMLFGISDIIAEDNAYIVFEVSRFDDYAYLFAEPFFLDLDEGASPLPETLRGMRIGINGSEPQVAQVWTNLDTTIGGVDYVATGQPISRLGTLIALDKGEQADEFFLTFEQLGSQTHVYSDIGSSPLVLSTVATRPDIGIRTFDEINASMSALTGVPPTYGDVPTIFDSIRKQLPSDPSLDGFLTAHQIAVAQLSIEYCNALVEAERINDSAVPEFFTGLNYATNANSISDADWRTLVISPLVQRFIGSGLEYQPNANAAMCELETLLFDSTAGSSACGAEPSSRPAPASLARCGGSCDSERTAIATKAACAAALGSATMLVQ